MRTPDAFAAYHAPLIEAAYDYVDRLVVNCYYPLGQAGGGFRTFWRQWQGGDSGLSDQGLRQGPETWPVGSGRIARSTAFSGLNVARTTSNMRTRASIGPRTQPLLGSSPCWSDAPPPRWGGAAQRARPDHRFVADPAVALCPTRANGKSRGTVQRLIPWRKAQ
jgi:hypothetical protein